ncbi:MAG: hypothetical protein LQ340_007264, partial [Diploschistes diacapsis]
MATSSHSASSQITRLTNCRLALPHAPTLVRQDLYLDSITGTIIDPQTAFYDHHTSPIHTVDLQDRIVTPGFIDVQINGCFGLDFSAPSPTYASDLGRVKKALLKTGVTSFLPTLTSQHQPVYRSTLPHLRADAPARDPYAGAESLGAHCEGPFISPSKCGIHAPECLRSPTSFADLEACYGARNLDPATIKLITLAPELDASRTVVPALRERGIIHSIGHSAATHDQALDSLAQGSTMITHLYNAMPQPHHRDPGIVGLLGASSSASAPASASASPSPSSSSSSSSPSSPPPPLPPSAGSTANNRPYFGIIADGIHVHPSMLALAHAAHPTGCILVTDAMSVLGLADGTYPWTNGEVFEKRGHAVVLRRTGGIAGSAVDLAT